MRVPTRYGGAAGCGAAGQRLECLVDTAVSRARIRRRHRRGARAREGGAGRLDANLGRVTLGARRSKSRADRGILVPVRFEGALLPIDARAIHTIDLDDWDYDSHSPALQQVCQSIAALLSAAAPLQAPLQCPSRCRRQALASR